MNEIEKKIIDLLISSRLSIDAQLIVIKEIQKKLQFCKIIGKEVEQTKLF